MTTTKKKAKAPTLAQRVKALECDAAELRGAGINLEKQVDMSLIVAQDFKRRLTALEQAQRPAEKPATENRAGPWVSAGFITYAHRKSTKGMPVCTVEPLSNSWWRAWAVNADGQPTHWWGTSYATEADARAACDAELVRLGWTLEDMPAPAAPAEDARLRDAVVDAALAWEAYGYGDDMSEAAAVDLCIAVNALRAHRAKKGGA